MGGRRPADTLEPIFLLAGCEERRSALLERTRAALSRADFGRLATELADRRLLPLIGSRALDAAGDLCPPGFQTAVETARRAGRARALAVEAATRGVVDLLAGEGIAALPLKGPLLAAAAHGDVGLRETEDVDLLVPRSRLSDAARLLAGVGYSRPADPIRGNGLPDIHLALDHPVRPSVELHWRVHWYEEQFSRDMLEQAEPGPDGLLRAQPDDLAASVLLFYARDGFHGVRLAIDAASWWDRHRDQLGPRFLERHARRYPELAPALTAAAVVTARLTGVPARDWLGDGAGRGHRVDVAARLSDWTQAGERDQLAANISLVDGLLGPRGAGAAFGVRALVPRSGSTGPHAAKMLARFAAALWHVRGGRWWSPAPIADGAA